MCYVYCHYYLLCDSLLLPAENPLLLLAIICLALLYALALL